MSDDSANYLSGIPSYELEDVFLYRTLKGTKLAWPRRGVTAGTSDLIVKLFIRKIDATPLMEDLFPHVIDFSTWSPDDGIMRDVFGVEYSIMDAPLDDHWILTIQYPKGVSRDRSMRFLHTRNKLADITGEDLFEQIWGTPDKETLSKGDIHVFPKC